nr:RNA-directed DNA polymerase, eukaryota [Tanacetum cinerariifolium]
TSSKSNFPVLILPFLEILPPFGLPLKHVVDYPAQEIRWVIDALVLWETWSKIRHLEDDSETKIPQDAPSFVQPNEQVQTPRPSVKPIETSILTTKTMTAIPKPKSNGICRNRKACFVFLRQKFENAEQERDELKLKLEKFQTSSKNLSQLLTSQTNDKTGLGYNTQVFTRFMFDCDEFFTSDSDDSLLPSPIYDRVMAQNQYSGLGVSRLYGLNVSFRRRPRGGIEESQFQELSLLLYSVVLSSSSDRWSWMLNCHGDFSVKSAREEIDKHLLVTSSSSTIRSKLLPIKLNVFAWLDAFTGGGGLWMIMQVMWILKGIVHTYVAAL